MNQTSRYSLYYSVRSPFARRVRVAMGRLEIPFEPKEMNVFEPPSDFLAANPLALVPVLVTGEGSAIPDSATILEYLHENYGERIWPKDLALRAEVRAAATLAEGVMGETVKWFLESQRAAPSPEWSREYVENIDRTLAAIAAKPLSGAPWMTGADLTQAGYDLMVALHYMRIRLQGFDWAAKYPALARFMATHESRPDLAPTTPPA